MTLESWVNWRKRQLGDLSLRLFRQGHHPALIAQLNETSPEFRKNHERLLNQLHQIMAAIEADPNGPGHFEAFAQAKKSLLEYANRHGESSRNPDLAKTA